MISQLEMLAVPLGLHHHKKQQNCCSSWLHCWLLDVKLELAMDLCLQIIRNEESEITYYETDCWDWVLDCADDLGMRYTLCYIVLAANYVVYDLQLI